MTTRKDSSQVLPALRERLRGAMHRDRHRLHGRLRAAEKRAQRGQPIDRMVADMQKQIDASVVQREQRANLRLAIHYPQDLPVSQRRDDLLKTIEANQVVVVCGATGSGKTTQLPKLLLELGHGVSGTIGHTQPRRLAARSVAHRLAEELQTPLGQGVGYQVRFDEKNSDLSRIKVMTDGILLNELTRDRRVSEYDAIIIDEAHERSLNIDFLLGYLKQLTAERSDLKIIITSATIDPESFSKHFDEAPIVTVEGRTYPVEVRYHPPASDDSEEITAAIVEATAELQRVAPGDVLVFLPGERDIRAATEALRGWATDQRVNNLDILPLYARLSRKEQDRIFHPDPGRRRVVLATNVAETSLTVPGIRHVIDTGLARISRYSARSRVQRLPIEPISQASADQRKGRCGRTAPGICVRLFDEASFEQRSVFTDPEIQRSNLAGVILQMAALGLGRIDRFPFIDPPAASTVREGHQTLLELRAIDERDQLTDLGRELANLPVDPRIGRMIRAGAEQGILRQMLVVAAALSVQDPRVRPPDAYESAERQQRLWWVPGASDFTAYLRLWRWYQQAKKQHSHGTLRRVIQQHYLAHTRMREWEEVHHQLRALITERGYKLTGPPIIPAEPKAARAEDDEPDPFNEQLIDALHRAILTGLLSHIGQKDERYTYLGARDRKFAIFPGSAMFEHPPKWLVAAELVETTKLYARTVGKIQPQWIEPLAAHLVQRQYTEARWDAEKQYPVVDERVTLWGLPIVERRTIPLASIDRRHARELLIYRGLVEGEIQTRGGFLKHNRQLIEQIEQLEAKRRKADVLVDAEMRYAFYDRIVPHDVVDAATFETWRAKAERRDRNLLMMTEADLMAHEASDVTAERYPDRLPVAGTELDLAYHIEPGDERDGVTVKVPLAMLNQVRPTELDWLVPGLLEEKVVALIKSLPKQLRKNFVPVPDFVAQVLPTLPRERDRPLEEVLAGTLSAVSGVRVAPGDFDPTRLPDHLRMNVAVVDNRDQPLATGRDVEQLKDDLSEKAERVFEQAATEARHAPAAACTGADESDETVTLPDDLTTLPEHPLPTEVRIQRGGAALTGHAAVVDRGPRNTATTGVFDTQPRAKAEHRAGLRRLFALQLGTEFAYLEADLPMDRLNLLARAAVPDRAHPAETTLAEDLVDATVNVTFLEQADPWKIRDRATFEHHLDRHRSRLAEQAREVAALAERILAPRAEVLRDLADAPNPWQPAVADMLDQLRMLFDARWLADTPWGWLCQYPRYLEALGKRIAKLEDGQISKDADLRARLEPMLEPYREAAARAAQRRIVDDELTLYRWMLEEYRVQLWAEDLGTFCPVSEKRLARQWAKVRV